MELGFLSLIPPLLTVGLAIMTKRIFASLILGIWCGQSLLHGGNPLLGVSKTIEACVMVFQSAYNTQVIFFCLLIGVLMTLTQRIGGVAGFVEWAQGHSLFNSKKKASLLAYITGVMIFIESSITCLISGAISRPLFDHYKISREKLAYILDSTSASVCILIPLNAWGAYVLGLLYAEKVDSPLDIFIGSIFFNFYPLITLIMVLMLVLTGLDFGPMKKAEMRAKNEGKLLADDAKPIVDDQLTAVHIAPYAQKKMSYLLLPVITMIIMMPISLYITGEGDLRSGQGATAVLWSVLSAIIVASLLGLFSRSLKSQELSKLTFQGISGLLPLAALMIFSFAIGQTTRDLGTGLYAAEILSQNIPVILIPALIFLVASFIAFATGTSWGVFAIMVPMAIPIALQVDLSLSLVLAAVLSGGVFGDNCSPISDTTMISSMAAVCDHIDHVRTQLPYALTSAFIAFFFFIVFALF